MATGDIREVQFTDATGFTASITVIENADGTLTFTVQVDETDGFTGDVRALYLNNTDDTEYSGLTISDIDVASDTTDLDMVQDIDRVRVVEEKDTNINGEVLQENDGRFDTGVEFGSSGMAVDDVQYVTFTLSADQPLSIDSFDWSLIGLRVTSVGEVDGNRSDSLKLGTTEVTSSTSNSLDDDGEVTTVGEEAGMTILDNVLANSVDPEEGDPTVVWFGNAQGGGTFSIASDGTASFDTNGEFEHLAEGEAATASVDYMVEDAGGLQVTSTYTVTVVGVNDLADNGENAVVMEGSGTTGLMNVLANTYDPEAGDPTVVDVDSPTIVSLSSLSTANVESTASTGMAGMNGGIFHINADGIATFDTNGEFEHLAEGETVTTSVDYTVQDAAGDQVTSTYTVTVVGVNDLSDEGEAATVGEDSGVTVLDNVLDNAVDPEAGDPVVVAVGPTAGGGIFTINADGSATFDTNDEFEALGAGETMISTVDYTIEDAAGDQVTSTYSVTIEGANDLSDEGETATVSEDSVVTALDNVLANAIDPEAGDPTVVSVGEATGGGIFTINADGSATFDTNGEFDALGAGETMISTVEYTIEDAAGDQVTSTYSVTIEGANEAPLALDDQLVTDEGVAATINILGNDSDPDGDALSIVEVNGATVGEMFSVTTGAGRTGTVVVDASGNLTFTPDSSFDDLNDGENDTVSFGYSITDGQFTSDANVTVLVNGSGSSGGKVTFNGSISTGADSSTHVVAIIDTNQFNTGIAFGATLTDVDGDGNYGTMVDLMISKVVDLAGTLAPTDKVTLVPSGFDGMGGDLPQSFTFEAGDLAAAATDTALLQNKLLQFAQTYSGMDFAIDLNQGLATAESVLTQDPATQNEIVVLTSSEAYDPYGADQAATSVETNAGADIDILYIEAGFYANAASLSAIDSDMTVDVDATMGFALSELVEPAQQVLATVEEFTITVDGTAVDGIDAASLVANANGDGFTFDGDVDLSGLSGEIDIIIGLDADNDPTTAADLYRLSDTRTADERTVTDGDTFLFDFDQVFV